jgi:hypothetical protein
MERWINPLFYLLTFNPNSKKSSMDWIGASDEGSDAAANACNSIRREQGKRPKRRSTQLGDDEEEQ